MLDLQAGIHLEEEDFAGGVEQAFDGAGVAVTELGDGLADLFVEPLAAGVAESGGGRGGFFDHFLVAALHGALAVAEDGYAALAVAEDLQLDVVRLDQQAFEVDIAGAEGAVGGGAGAAQRAGELLRAAHLGHADPAAAERGFDQQRVADRFGGRFGFVVGDRAVAAGDHGQAELVHRAARLVLVAHQLHVFGRGADEGDAARLAGLGEVGVFGEQPVAGVDGVAAGRDGGVEHGVDVDVGLGDGGRADVGRAVGFADMQGVGVGHGVDGVGLDAESAAGARDARGDFAAVGDQDAGEHDGAPDSVG